MAERIGWRPLAVLACLLALGGAAHAGEAAPAAANPKQEAQMMAIAAELRCLVCQNQTIADSHAGLAVDLRQQIREMLAKGMTEREIADYMTERYGDFVLYRPPFKASTALLWVGPALLLVGALGTLILVLRRRQRLGADAFDPDVPDDEASADVPNR
ncbi:MAG: cytochrome c-type biogenesis protein CcmH [Burkholderiales bacterium]|nr:cytochrome c-type biogenesis protein CcmH [Burkholderiales bacterium]